MANAFASIGLSVLLSAAVAGGVAFAAANSSNDSATSLGGSVNAQDNEGGDLALLRKEIKDLNAKIDEISSQRGGGRPDRKLANDFDALRKEVQDLRASMKNQPAAPSTLGDVTEKGTSESAAKLTGSEADFRRMLEKVEEVREAEERAQREAEQITRRAEQRTQFIDRLSKGLTDLATNGTIAAADQTRISEILTSRYDRQMEMWSNPGNVDWRSMSDADRQTAMQEMREKREAITSESDAALKGILNDDQVEKVMGTYNSSTGMGGGRNFRGGGGNAPGGNNDNGNGNGGGNRRGRG